MILITCGLHGLCCFLCGCLVTAKGNGYRKYGGSKGVVDCAELKGFFSECCGELGTTHESIGNLHSLHDSYGDIIKWF